MKTWKYCDYSETVRQMPENYCLFSAKTFGDGGTYDSAALPEAAQNLRLAAAAPDLLHALQLVVDTGADSTLFNFAQSKARAAIRKARGES